MAMTSLAKTYYGPEFASGGKGTLVASCILTQVNRVATPWADPMFESRFQIAQLILTGAFIFAALAILTLMFGPIVIGVTCLVLEHVVAAIGCAVYADAKGYPYLIGVPVGVALGVVGGIVFVVLPDEAPDDEMERQHRMASEAYRNARNRDPGYEVLDDDD